MSTCAVKFWCPVVLGAVAAAISIAPAAGVAASAWESVQQYRINSTGFTQAMISQFAPDGSVYNAGMTGPVIHGDRAISFNWAEDALMGVFVYDYTEGRFTLGAWSLPRSF